MTASRKYRKTDEKSTTQHPEHYQRGGLETIDVIRGALTEPEFDGFLAGNIIKYICRYQSKGGREDLIKARTYLDWLIERN